MKDWTEHYDSSGNKYYFNEKTQESRWDEPLPKGCSKPVFSAGGAQLTPDEIMNRLFTDIDNSPIFEKVKVILLWIILRRRWMNI